MLNDVTMGYHLYIHCSTMFNLPYRVATNCSVFGAVNKHRRYVHTKGVAAAKQTYRLPNREVDLQFSYANMLTGCGYGIYALIHSTTVGLIRLAFEKKKHESVRPQSATRNTRASCHGAERQWR